MRRDDAGLDVLVPRPRRSPARPASPSADRRRRPGPLPPGGPGRPLLTPRGRELAGSIAVVLTLVASSCVFAVIGYAWLLRF